MECVKFNNVIIKLWHCRDSLVIILSALYAKLLIVLGICFPMAEVISRRIPPAVYEVGSPSLSFSLIVYASSLDLL